MEKVKKYFFNTILIIWFCIVAILMISRDYLKRVWIFEVLVFFSIVEIVGAKVINWLLNKYEYPTIILFCCGITMLMFTPICFGIWLLSNTITYLRLASLFAFCSIVLILTVLIIHIIMYIIEKIKVKKNRH